MKKLPSFKLFEKSVSKSQQRLFGVALSVKRGEQNISDVPASYREMVKNVVDGMTEKQIEDYAKTSHKGLPDKKDK